MAQLKKQSENTPAPASEGSIAQVINTPRFKESLAQILPKHLTSERFAAVAMRQFRTTPGLLKCTPESVLSAFMEAAGLGLEIGLNGESYIIPWFNKVKDADGNWTKVNVAQLQIGYLGHMKLAWNSGLISSIESDVVTKEEVESGRFTYQRGTDGFLHHKPEADRDLREQNIAFAWGMVWIKGSDRPIWRVIDKGQIERLRNTGQSANSPAWKNHYDEMAQAKVLKRTLKWAPKSREQARAVAVDDEADAGISQTFEGSEAIAALLPATGPKPAAQEMMERAQANGRDADVPQPAPESRQGPDRDGQPASAPPREAEEPPTPTDEQGGLGW